MPRKHDIWNFTALVNIMGIYDVINGLKMEWLKIRGRLKR